MSKNLQFLDDPDDVAYINENFTIHVGVNGSDTENDGSENSPFRTLGKAVDVVRDKKIKKDKFVTIQLGAIDSSRTGSQRKYFEEEEITVDFEDAKRLKIKGTKPTDHEIIGISYFDKASDRDGYYCQILVTNQDKICIGDYLTIYDHLKIKKKDPSYFWTIGATQKTYARSVTPNNCYVEAIRGDMIVGVHEVVDVGIPMNHEGNYATLDTELFSAQDVKVGCVTLHIKNHNYTYNRLNEVPFYNSLGTLFGKPLFTYAGGPGNSPIEAQQNNTIPPVFYGVDLLSNPETAESNGFEQFYYSNPVQQIELVDIMVRGYGFALVPLNNKIIDPRTRERATDATLLWNDKTLTGVNRAVVATTIASYFYKKMIVDLGIESDLPFYFGKSSNPFITIEELTRASIKVRDYLLGGARQIEGVPSWDEENHPGYGFGPFESGAVRNPIGGGADIDTTSYPSVYADLEKQSLLLRYYNIYPPINGQLYQPTLLKRISSWYNDNGTRFGLQLDRWSKKGNQSPFFCGYITPQGWYKQSYTNPNDVTRPIPSLLDETDPNGYHLLFGGKSPNYVGNTYTTFNKINNGDSGVFSNERSATKNLFTIDPDSYYFEAGGLTSASVAGPSGSTAYQLKGSMGSVWYAGLVNLFRTRDGSDVAISQFGTTVFDRYSLGYANGVPISSNDSITTKNETPVEEVSTILFTSQTANLRAKCHKSVLRFGKNGIKVTSKTKLGLIKDLCIVGISTSKSNRYYGLVADKESTINASNIGVSSFTCGISSRNQSLVNLLADLGNSTTVQHKGIIEPLDPGAIVTGNDIGIESSLKSHINAQRTVSSGSKSANYLAIANSSIDCSNSMSVCGFKHGIVSEFNSYIKATNAFSEFNGGIGFVSANNSILVCHRGRAIWNGSHGVLANINSTIKAYEFISRGNDGDGFLAQNKSTISAGANSSNWVNYRREVIASGVKDISGQEYRGILTMLPPHLFQVTIVHPPVDPNNPIKLPAPSYAINSNPTAGLNVFFHECNSTISEFNSGSGFASETDSILIADNTISRFNSKKYGEFFIYGWSGLRGSFPTDTFAPFEGVI
jgi:hypothetical protein